MTFKSIIDRAKTVAKDAARAKRRFDTKLEKSRAESIKRQAEREAAETKRLDEHLTSLKKQRGRLVQRDAINRKRKEIQKLEERVTTKGRIMKRINDELTSLERQATGPKKRKRRRR